MTMKLASLSATAEQRAKIRAKAESLGMKYRITREGEVHFYGRMPNSAETGWWLYEQSPEFAVRAIEMDSEA